MSSYIDRRAKFYGYRQKEHHDIQHYAKVLKKLFKKMKRLHPQPSKPFHKDTLAITFIYGLFHASVRHKMCLWLKKIQRHEPSRLTLQVVISTAQVIENNFYNNLF